MKLATREAYGYALAELVTTQDHILVLDADLSKSTKTCDAKKARAEHHFNLGIAEGNMMGVAAGLAMSGKTVFVSSFAMFAAGRAYEQIRNSIAYPQANVKICATHAGISVGEDGATHQCNEDLALMRVLPGMMVLQPCDAIETYAMIRAIANTTTPCYVRLGRTAVEDVHKEDYEFLLGKGDIIQQGSHIAIIATGLMVQEALIAAKSLHRKITIVNIHTLKPLDENLIEQIAKSHKILIICEEHSIIGGLQDSINHVLIEKNISCKVHGIGIQDVFGESGRPEELLRKYGVDHQAILQIAKQYDIR